MTAFIHSALGIATRPGVQFACDSCVKQKRKNRTNILDNGGWCLGEDDSIVEAYEGMHPLYCLEYDDDCWRKSPWGVLATKGHSDEAIKSVMRSERRLSRSAASFSIF